MADNIAIGISGRPSLRLPMVAQGLNTLQQIVPHALVVTFKMIDGYFLSCLGGSEHRAAHIPVLSIERQLFCPVDDSYFGRLITRCDKAHWTFFLGGFDGRHETKRINEQGG